MTTRVKPPIAITMGDAAGIGPEIIVKALHLEEIYRICCPLVIGEALLCTRLLRCSKAR